MTLLYVTADQIGIQTGGGSVTYHESEALKTLGHCYVVGRKQLEEGMVGAEPWGWDLKAANHITFNGAKSRPKLAHFYAGCFTDTIRGLKQNGAKVSYTAAAHKVSVSKQEHENLGLVFNYPHLTDPAQWERYVGGYLEADVVICPSTHSAECMRSYGCKNIEIIPHGVDIPEKTYPPTKNFRVGYMGSFGPDKGLRYLLEAWKALNYKDGSLLVLAGKDSIGEWAFHLIERFGGGSICTMGWVDNPSDFYNNISMYVQPSASEGFGLEVLEAQAHARLVLCSDGAGAADTVDEHQRFKAGNVNELAKKIDAWKGFMNFADAGLTRQKATRQYTWGNICKQYVNVWQKLLGWCEHP